MRRLCKQFILYVISISLLILNMSIGSANNSKDTNIITNSGADNNIVGWGGNSDRVDITYHSGGAAGTSGCVKVTTKADYGQLTRKVNLVLGETYDVEFYARTENISSAISLFVYYSDNSYDFWASDVSINSTWRKISFSYEFTGINHKGETVKDGSNILFNFRLGNGLQHSTFYIDEFTVSSRGFVESEKEEDTTEETKAIDIKTITFDDLENHWVRPTVEALFGNGLINGVSEKYFEPERNVTKAEAVAMVVKSYGLRLGKYNGLYKDVKLGDWYADYIQTAFELEIFTPSSKGEEYFYPNKQITRQEVCSIFVKVAESANFSKVRNSKIFVDDAKIGAQYKESVYDAVKFGIVNGYSDDTFRPDGVIKRCEMAEMLKSFIELDSRIAIFVNHNSGNDFNMGTFAQPVKTVQRAQELIRSNNATMKYNVYVFLSEGLHYMYKPWSMNYHDSGKNGYNIVYTSYGNGKADIVGGKPIENFQLFNEDAEIYRAYVGSGTKSRQLFVNGRKAVRARSEGSLNNIIYDEGNLGFTTTDTFIAKFRRPHDLEFVYFAHWMQQRCMLDSIAVADNIATLYMAQPFWNTGINKKHGNLKKLFYYENALELLNEPGEWYLDSEEGYLYYKPRVFETMHTAEVVLPVQESLLLMEGQLDSFVSNITFVNVNFAYTTWTTPTTNRGYVSFQNGVYSNTGSYADMEIIPSAVLVKNADNINFTNCSFKKMGGSGLYFFGGIRNCYIDKNEFSDISGTALWLGEIDINLANNRNKYLPNDERYFVTDNRITNNYIHQVGTDYMGCAGLTLGHPINTLVSNNEIFDIPYSGIHIGWGWDLYANTGSATKNLIISNNYIHNVMNNLVYDGGAIYAVGATGGNADNLNQITGNYVENVGNLSCALYPDEGSTFWEITKNVVDLSDHPYWYGNGNSKSESSWLHLWKNTIKNNVIKDNYSTTKKMLNNSPKENVFENAHVYEDRSWPEEALNIIKNAGIKNEYLHLFPVEVQEIVIDKSEYTMLIGEEDKIRFKAETRKDIKTHINPDYVYFETDKKGIVSVDKSGNIKAINQGWEYVYAHYLMGDLVKTFKIKVMVDDFIADTEFNVEGRLELYEGDKYTLRVKNAKSVFGNNKDVKGINLKFANQDIAKVDEEGNIVALKQGKTDIEVEVICFDSTLTKTIPLEVMDASLKPKENIYNIGELFGDLQGWNTPNNCSKTPLGDNAMAISVPAGMLGYEKEMFENEIFAFDLQVNAEVGAWPSIAFRQPSPNKDFTENSLYIVTFRNNAVELQRIINGQKTYIYGEEGSYVPLEGGRIPVDFEYGKRYSVQVGAINDDIGVRIIVRIDGKEIIDYVDKSEDRLGEAGYLGFYVRSGEMELYPYSK